MTASGAGRRTDVQFWDEAWARGRSAFRIDETFSFERCLATALIQDLASVTGSVLEIGCAPGRWLAFLAERKGLDPYGIDSSSIGVEAARNLLGAMGIDPSRVIQGDLAEVPPRPTHDAVLSLGLIEHFDDPDAIVDIHAKWLKPGGVLLLGVPNFRGIHGRLQSIMDSGYLEKHNPRTMSTAYFESLSGRFGLRLEQSRHLGSFEPAMIAEPREMGPAQVALRWVLKPAYALRRIRALDRWNHPWWSSYLLARFRKETSR